MFISKLLPTSLKYKLYQSYHDKILMRFFPKRIVSSLYRNRLGEELKWKNPDNINEITQILKFKCDLDEWAIMADKYRVREYVQSKSLGHILIPLYGVYDKPEEIDFDLLPESFVMKTNNRSGDTVIVTDKANIDRNEIIAKFNKLLATPFGKELYEPHYLRIKPKIIIEKFLDLTKQDIESPSLVDYKVWCFYGRPYCIEMYFNRVKESEETRVYDLDWNPIDYAVKPGDHYRSSTVDIPRPRQLDEMLKYAEILCKNQPVVRADFYITGGQIYFGELTLTPSGGFQFALSDRFLKELAAQVDKDRIL